MQGEMNFDDPIEDMNFDDAKDTPSCRRCSTELIPKVNWTKWAYENNRYICRKCKSETRKELSLAYYAKHSDPNHVWDPKLKLECFACKKVKTAEGNFFHVLHNKTGYDHRCKNCYQSWEYKYRQIKAGAKGRGYDFTLELQDTSGMLLDSCYYCGKPSQEGIKIHGLDRVENDRGYDIDNVVPCCSECNIAKATQTQEEFIEQAHRIANKHPLHNKKSNVRV